MKIKKKNRSFIVGEKKKLQIKHVANVTLANDEQLTFLFKNSEYDFVKKNWGFYATPSINGRLKNERFFSALVKNKKKMLYLMVVHKSKIREFNKYCKNHNQKIIKWLYKD
jgi:hypothetical protein